jgi:hypothetical protein
MQHVYLDIRRQKSVLWILPHNQNKNTSLEFINHNNNNNFPITDTQYNINI